MNTEKKVKEAFDLAAERFAAVNVDVNSALEKLQKISLSLHCWQAHDVTGFENPDGSLSGGIQVTGNYPGKARNIDEVRADILTANSFIPGTCMKSMAISEERKWIAMKWNLPISRVGWSGGKRTI